MLANPSSFYEKKRTWTLLKVKKYEDFEAKIVSKTEHKVKRGKKKEFEMEKEGGIKFKLRAGLNYMNYETAIGTSLTIRCQGFSPNGQPIRPSFFRTKRRI